MSTTYELTKQNGTEIEITESSGLLTFNFITPLNGMLTDSWENGVQYHLLRERFTADALLPMIVKLARAASYCADNPDEFTKRIIMEIS